jgi:hypothetical protein
MLFLWRGHPTVATALAVLGAALCLAALVIPERLGPTQRAWMSLALAISKVTTPVFMAVVYFFVLTPTGILRRTLGRNPLTPPTHGTRWISRTADDRSDLMRQF